MPNSTPKSMPNPTPTSEPIAQPRSKQCRHVHVTGTRCGSPCLRGEDFCYYHHAGRPRVSRADREALAVGYPIQLPFQLPLVEDRASIMLALNQVLHGIFSKQIDSKQSGQALYALQVACSALLREPTQTRSRSNSNRRNSSHKPPTLNGKDPYAQNSYDQTPAQDPAPSPSNLYVEEIILDPILGPVAPIANLPDPESQPAEYQRPLSMVESWMQALMQEKEQYDQEEKLEYEQRKATHPTPRTPPQPTGTKPESDASSPDPDHPNPAAPAILPTIKAMAERRHGRSRPNRNPSHRPTPRNILSSCAPQKLRYPERRASAATKTRHPERGAQLRVEWTPAFRAAQRLPRASLAIAQSATTLSLIPCPSSTPRSPHRNSPTSVPCSQPPSCSTSANPGSSTPPTSPAPS